MSDERPITPPTEPVAIRPVRLRSSWPTLLGVVSIVFGVLGSFNGLMAAAAPLMMSWFESMMGEAGDVTMFGFMKDWTAWTVASGVVNVVLALLLLAAGVGLTMRRVWGARLQVAWAWLKIVWGPAVVVLSVFIQRDQMQAVQADMEAQGQAIPAPMMTGMVGIMMLVTGILGVLWAWALPVASLLWLYRPKIRAEVRTWERGGSAPA